MFHAVITFVTEEASGPEGSEFGDIKDIVTKVFRVEFPDEESFREWMENAEAFDGTMNRL